MDRPILSAASVQDLADQFGTVLSLAAVELSTADLAGIERRVQQVGQQVFGRVVEAVVATRAAAAAPTERVCPRCAQPLRLVAAARARHLQGLVGEYALVRAYYHCAACRQGYAPLDAELGLGPGALSPGLSRVACRLGIEEAFAPAAEVLWETLQVAVPAESVRRITEGLGAVAEAEQQTAMAQAWGGADPPLPAAPPAQLVVAVDGVMVHSDGDWHELKVGVVAPLGPATWTDPESGRVCQERGAPSVCAGLEPAAQFWWRIYCEARRCGLGHPTLLLVVLRGDGADWIWRAAARFLAVGPVAFVEIVDIYHAWEHRWTVAHAVFGTGSAAAAAWAEPLKRRLETEGPAPVLAALDAVRLPSGETADVVRKARDYFTEHAARMDYPTFVARQWPIGSGVIESANKALITAREKGPGMRWRGTGAQAVASLRAIHRSGRWDAFWATAPQRRRPPVFPRQPAHIPAEPLPTEQAA